MYRFTMKKRQWKDIEGAREGALPINFFFLYENIFYIPKKNIFWILWYIKIEFQTCSYNYKIINFLWLMNRSKRLIFCKAPLFHTKLTLKKY